MDTLGTLQKKVTLSNWLHFRDAVAGPERAQVPAVEPAAGRQAQGQGRRHGAGQRRKDRLVSYMRRRIRPINR